MKRVPTNEPRHPISVVSARTGIPADLLRAWEKRYTAVAPGRGSTGRRLYSDDDVVKLRLLKQAVSAGRRIGDIAALSTTELRALIDEDRQQGAAGVFPPTSPVSEASDFLALAISALEHLDRSRLEKALEDAAVQLSPPRVRRDVLVPLLQSIGDRWREGNLRIVHEHLASSVVRAFIATIPSGSQSPDAPRIIVTTPAGERHELGALLVANVATEAGWNVTYLGPDLPAEEIAAAVRQLEPQVVALSVVYHNGLRQLQGELRKLRRFVGPSLRIVVGGRAIDQIRSHLSTVDIQWVRDLEELPALLSAEK